MTNSLKLRAAIIERGFTQEEIAAKLGVSLATFNRKLNNLYEFKASEIKTLSELLYLKAEETMVIFCAKGEV